MRVRIKFVLILTLVVSIILIGSIFLIYTLFAHTRKQEFERRLWAHAYSEYLSHYDLKETNKAVLNKLENYLPGYPLYLQKILIDSSFHVISRTPGNSIYSVDTAMLLALKDQKETYFSDEQHQGVGLYLENNGHQCYSIAIGYDKYGIGRLANLRMIMIFVAFGGVIVIGLFALIYVVVATRPLVNLSSQMRRISETNLTQRVKIGRGNVRNNEIVQIASNFNDMLNRLEKAFAMQKNFVHHASHDLRTPLATMLSQTESALKKDLTPAEAKRVLESLKEDQLGMIELTNSLLLLSQYENLHFSHNWPMIRVDEIVYDSILAAKKLLPDLTISFNYTEPPEDENVLAIKGNETLLRSAFMNLMKNAYKYSDNKSINIILDIHPGAVLVHFENTGKIINEADREKIFLPFFRSEHSKKVKGFGLGLSIVKRIAEIHNCNITYKATNENTNCFTMRFEKL